MYGRRSRTLTPAGTAVSPEPTLVMRSPSTTTTASRVTPPLPSTSRPNRIAVAGWARAVLAETTQTARAANLIGRLAHQLTITE